MPLVRIRDVGFYTDTGHAVAMITFDSGETLDVDFTERVKNRPKLKPLLAEFAAGRIVDSGVAIEWPCGIDIDAVSLYRTAQGMAVRRWRKRHRLTQAAAGEALGVTGRTIQLYENGDQPTPKTIVLAMRGYDAVLAEREPIGVG